MKYFFALLIPPAAIIDCGRTLQGIINAILWAASCVLLMVSWMFLPLFGDSVNLVIGLSGALWFAVCTHAFAVVSRQSAEVRALNESKLAEQQIALMRTAAARMISVRASQLTK